jgi:hypothetical protein
MDDVERWSGVSDWVAWVAWVGGFFPASSQPTPGDPQFISAVTFQPTVTSIPWA